MACSLPPQIKLRIGVYNYSLSFISSLCKFCESQLPNITFDFISCRMKDSAKYLSDNLLDLCFPACLVVHLWDRLDMTSSIPQPIWLLLFCFQKEFPQLCQVLAQR
jgi:hypothetical protein